MRRLIAFGLVLAVVRPGLAAPQKDNLPAGAIARLGLSAPPAKGNAGTGRLNALAFLDETTVFVGTSAGWRTWDVAKRQPRQEKPVGLPAFAVFRNADRLFVGSAHKLHCVEPVQSATADPARSWDSATSAVQVLAGSPDGGRVVFANGDQQLGVLDPKSGKVIGHCGVRQPPGRRRPDRERPGAGCRHPRWGRSRLPPVRERQRWSPCGPSALPGRTGRGSSSRPTGTAAVSSAGRVMLLDAVIGRPIQSLECRFGEGACLAVRVSPRTEGSWRSGCRARGDRPRLGRPDRGGADDVPRTCRGRERRGLFAGRPHPCVGRVVARPSSCGKCPRPTPVPNWGRRARRGRRWTARRGHRLSQHGRPALPARPGGDGHPRRIPRDVGRAGQDPGWISELDHDEFRVREAARRSLLKAGLRAAAALNDPGRKKMGRKGRRGSGSSLKGWSRRGCASPRAGCSASRCGPSGPFACWKQSAGRKPGWCWRKPRRARPNPA